MSLQIEPIHKIKIKVGIQKDGPLQKFIANTWYEHMDKYVPMDSGDLASMVSISTNGKYVIYEVPYAEYQWRGERKDGTHKINEENRNRSKHEQATSRWGVYTRFGTRMKMDKQPYYGINKSIENYIKKRMGL